MDAPAALSIRLALPTRRPSTRARNTLVAALLSFLIEASSALGVGGGGCGRFVLFILVLLCVWNRGTRRGRAAGSPRAERCVFGGYPRPRGGRRKGRSASPHRGSAEGRRVESPVVLDSGRKGAMKGRRPADRQPPLAVPKEGRTRTRYPSTGKSPHVEGPDGAVRLGAGTLGRRLAIDGLGARRESGDRHPRAPGGKRPRHLRRATGESMDRSQELRDVSGVPACDWRTARGLTWPSAPHGMIHRATSDDAGRGHSSLAGSATLRQRTFLPGWTMKVALIPRSFGVTRARLHNAEPASRSDVTSHSVR